MSEEETTDEKAELRKILSVEMEKNRDLTTRIALAVDAMEKITTVGDVKTLEDAVGVCNLALPKIRGIKNE